MYQEPRAPLDQEAEQDQDKTPARNSSQSLDQLLILDQKLETWKIKIQILGNFHRFTFLLNLIWKIVV